jgi:hypothetical protein
VSAESSAQQAKVAPEIALEGISADGKSACVRWSKVPLKLPKAISANSLGQ